MIEIFMSVLFWLLVFFCALLDMMVVGKKNARDYRRDIDERKKELQRMH